MKLAINYSPAAAELYRQGKIVVDAFKVPDWPDLVAEARRLCPPAVHFTLLAGDGRLAQADWSLVDRLLAETATPYINVHIEAHARDHPEIPAEATEQSLIEPVLDNLRQDIQCVVSRYGAERVIAENIPYHGAGSDHLRACVDPQVITSLLEETGCGLLLDIAHARISAHYLGMTDTAYLEQLPVQRIREMHFAGLHTTPNGLQDHLSALPEDWKLLEWVLERIRSKEWGAPWMLAFEYGGVGAPFAWRTDPAVIAEQVPRLYEMVHAG